MNSATGYGVFLHLIKGGTSEHSEILAANYEVRSLGNDGTLSDGSQISAGVAGDLA